MLEHVPHWLGSALRTMRAGFGQLVIFRQELLLTGARLELSSPAFDAGGPLPPRCTADGEGLSPPLVWSEPPAGTASLALIVEDPDAPAPHPLVHAIVWGLPADERRLAEGAIARHGAAAAEGAAIGRNSYFAQGWLPPDPPTGHGAHAYVFQLFALCETLAIGERLGRAEFVAAIASKVRAAGMLVGTYERGGPARAGGTEAAAPAAV